MCPRKKEEKMARGHFLFIRENSTVALFSLATPWISSGKAFARRWSARPCHHYASNGFTVGPSLLVGDHSRYHTQIKYHFPYRIPYQPKSRAAGNEYNIEGLLHSPFSKGSGAKWLLR